MSALQKAKPVVLASNGLRYVSVSLPKQQRTTRVEKNMNPDEIAAEIVAWIGKDS
jgi:electron transfer flavoprotein beta subunit